MSYLLEESDRRTLLTKVRARLALVEGGCWEWTGAVNHGGYGVFSVTVALRKRVQYRVHRLVYDLMVGPIPDAMEIDHLCLNRRCANPAHLEAVTSAENLRRAAERQTICKQGHPRTPENLREHLTKAGVRRMVCKPCAREKALARYHATKQLKGRAPLKTHCLRGHELTDDNVVRFRYSRHCKACARERYAERKARVR